MNPFDKFEQNIAMAQAMKAHLEEIDTLEGDENAIRLKLEKRGVDLSSINIDKYKITDIVESFKNQAELLQNGMFNVDNPKSVGLMNFLTKINEDGFDRERDGKTLIHLANAYFEEEQKLKAARCFHIQQQQCNAAEQEHGDFEI